MPRLSLKVLRKPECTDVVIAAHAVRENHYAILVHSLKVSQVFKLQDAHNASSMNMSWGESPRSECKNKKNR